MASLLQLNSKIKPEIEITEAKKLVEKLYPFKVKAIHELESYDDRNFRIAFRDDRDKRDDKDNQDAQDYEDDEDDEDDVENQFVLKITNCLDSAVPGLIEAINEISTFVKESADIEVPVPIPTTDGNLVTRETLANSESQFAVRLMTFVPGSIMNTIEYTPDILTQVGEACGRLTKCLKDFNNPILASRETIWSLLNVGKLDSYLTAINDKKNHALVKKIIKKFDTKVTSLLDTLPNSIIHGDLNEQNIVVDIKDEKYNFAGLIDFGDSHKAPTVFDLAILCAYLTLDCPKTIDPLEAPKYIIAGYESVLELTEQEWNILPTCMLARFAQSVTLGTYTHANDTENDYLLTSVRKMWRIMEMMIEIDDENLIKRWR